MATTVQKVVTTVRAYISDETATYRWSDADLIVYVNDGQREVYMRNPTSAFTGSSVTTTAPADVTAVGDSITLTDGFAVALAHYVAMQVFLEDSEDANNLALANQHQAHFERLVPL